MRHANVTGRANEVYCAVLYGDSYVVCLSKSLAGQCCRVRKANAEKRDTPPEPEANEQVSNSGPKLEAPKHQDGKREDGMLMSHTLLASPSPSLPSLPLVPVLVSMVFLMMMFLAIMVQCDTVELLKWIGNLRPRSRQARVEGHASEVTRTGTDIYARAVFHVAEIDGVCCPSLMRDHGRLHVSK